MAPATPDAIGAPVKPNPKPVISATNAPISAQSAPVKSSHSPSPIAAKLSACLKSVFNRFSVCPLDSVVPTAPPG